MGFHLAYARQTIEVAGVRLINHGPEARVSDFPILPRPTYAGREHDAPWRRAADQRIDRLRKAEMRVAVVDADGRPVPGAQVHARMTRHAFPFSTAVLPHLIEKGDATGERYRRTLLECFNGAVMENTFKGGDWGNPDIRARAPRVAQWLADHQMTQRGHYLTMGVFDHLIAGVPAERVAAIRSDPVALRSFLNRFADEVIAASGGHIADWDAVNHLTAYWGTKLDEVAGGLHVYADFIRDTRARHPGLLLAVNESSFMDEYERRIRYLVEHDAKPDAIGFMSHFSETNLPTPDQLLALLDRFAAFGVPPRATEFDVASNDEELQADDTRDFYTVYFSHPKVDTIVTWGFWEGAHWRPETALFRRDWSIKPRGRAYRDLVDRRWWTDQTLTTDPGGEVRLSGFLGDYVVTATAGDRRSEARARLERAGLSLRLELVATP